MNKTIVSLRRGYIIQLFDRWIPNQISMTHDIFVYTNEKKNFALFSLIHSNQMMFVYNSISVYPPAFEWRSLAHSKLAMFLFWFCHLFACCYFFLLDERTIDHWINRWTPPADNAAIEWFHSFLIIIIILCV